MKLYIKDIAGLQTPKQANEGEDAAYDIVATTPPQIHGAFIERPLDGLKLYSRVVFIEYGTNLFIAPEDEVTYDYSLMTDGGPPVGKQVTQFHTLLHPRSSICKYNLALANSVAIIDTGYRNEIFIRFKYLFQPEDMVVIQEDTLRVYGRVNNEHIYQKGDRVAQIKASPNIPIVFERITNLPVSKRGLGGFGSSGK